MSIHGRRYDSVAEVTFLKYDRVRREEEEKSFVLKDFDKDNLSLFIDDHVDYAILSVIILFRQKIVTEQECDRVIDMIEGYYFGYQEKLLTDIQLYSKIREIMYVYFYRDFNFIAMRSD